MAGTDAGALVAKEVNAEIVETWKALSKTLLPDGFSRLTHQEKLNMSWSKARLRHSAHFKPAALGLRRNVGQSCFSRV
jgi:hypothetical protein